MSADFWLGLQLDWDLWHAMRSPAAAQIAQRSLTIEANANAEGHLYGSVNADQIAAALRTEGFPIASENIRIEGPLKELGLYSIKVHLAQDIVSEVKLWVVPTHSEEAPT